MCLGHLLELIDATKLAGDKRRIWRKRAYKHVEVVECVDGRGEVVLGVVERLDVPGTR